MLPASSPVRACPIRATTRPPSRGCCGRPKKPSTRSASASRQASTSNWGASPAISPSAAKSSRILTENLPQRTRYTTGQVLASAGLQWTDIAHVLLVGGSTRMPMVSRMLQRLTGRKPQHQVHPDEAVARGAALFAGYLLARRDDRWPGTGSKSPTSIRTVWASRGSISGQAQGKRDPDPAQHGATGHDQGKVRPPHSRPAIGRGPGAGGRKQGCRTVHDDRPGRAARSAPQPDRAAPRSKSPTPTAPMVGCRSGPRCATCRTSSRSTCSASPA